MCYLPVKADCQGGRFRIRARLQRDGMRQRDSMSTAISTCESGLSGGRFRVG